MAVELPMPPEIDALLEKSVLSIEELEVLLLLRAGGQTRTPSQLADSLNIPEIIAESALASLERSGFLVSSSQGRQLAYVFAPHTSQLAAAVETLVAYYQDNRMQVILTISNNAIERMRHGVLRRFSDAFRISKDKKDG
jgi:DNA-binding MarR family transcriptional regulator